MEEAINRVLAHQYKAPIYVPHLPKAPPLRLTDPSTPRRLLIPASRLPDHIPSVSSASINTALYEFMSEESSRSPRSRHTPGKLTRTLRSPAPGSLSGLDTFANTPSTSPRAFSEQDDVFSSDMPARPPWVQTFLGNFEIVHDSVELRGFQLYAVEKWLTQRTKFVTTIAVFTGDQKDKIDVTVLQPSLNLEEDQALDEFHHAIQMMRQDGARPKESPEGVIMITFLPNFRPDLAIVHIPDGNFRAVQERLYANINLLRLGCAGRSALTLDEPFDSTKEKFTQMYHLADHISHHASSTAPKATSPTTRGRGSTTGSQDSNSTVASSRHGSRADDPPSFQTTVLSFVKIIQSAISLFGMFDVADEERDGLLCDKTVEGIRACVNEITQLVDLEPSERVLDPSAAAAILSTVISARNKLHTLGVMHRKDPFMEPAVFVVALINLQMRAHHKYNAGSQGSSPISPSPNISRASTISISPYLSYELLERINALYTLKCHPNDPAYKVHRAIKHKIDDSMALASNISGTLASNISDSLRSPAAALGLVSPNMAVNDDGGLEHVPGCGTLEAPLTDLALLSKMICFGHPVHGGVGSSSGKESGSGHNGVDSLRYVWTGKKNAGVREKERKERGKKLIEGQKERLRGIQNQVLTSPSREDATGRHSTDGRVKSDGEEGAGGSGFRAPGLLWKGTGRLLGNGLAELGIGRARKNNDVQSDPESSATPGNSVFRHQDVPAVTVTEASRRDIHGAFSDALKGPDSLPASGQASPTLFTSTAPPSSSQIDLALELATASRVGTRSLDLMRPRPGTWAHDGASTPPSHSDPLIQFDKFEKAGHGGRLGHHRRKRNFTEVFEDEDEDDNDASFGEEGYVYQSAGEGLGDNNEDDLFDVEWWIRKPVRHKRPGESDRRHSIACMTEYQGYPRIPPDRMRADVDLCSAYFDLLTKQEDMDRISILLHSLLNSTQRTNNLLSRKLFELERAYNTIDARAQQLSFTTRQARAQVEEISQGGLSLDYRVHEIEKGKRGLEITLAGYKRRKNQAMEAAGAVGANALLTTEDSKEKTAALEQLRASLDVDGKLDSNESELVTMQMVSQEPNRLPIGLPHQTVNELRRKFKADEGE
ncbi:hypothetical protein FRB94_005265 [Tulasnella sp. JGI-2019a]|nr:hypothetical protein FRB94_005265 [Tulasnella sp. JGI-2019a]